MRRLRPAWKRTPRSRQRTGKARPRRTASPVFTVCTGSTLSFRRCDVRPPRPWPGTVLRRGVRRQLAAVALRGDVAGHRAHRAEVLLGDVRVTDGDPELLLDEGDELHHADRVDDPLAEQRIV